MKRGDPPLEREGASNPFFSLNPLLVLIYILCVLHYVMKPTSEGEMI